MELFQRQINEGTNRAALPAGKEAAAAAGAAPGPGEGGPAEPSHRTALLRKVQTRGWKNKGEINRYQGDAAGDGGKPRKERGGSSPERMLGAYTEVPSSPERRGVSLKNLNESSEEKGFLQLVARGNPSFPPLAGKKGKK